MKLDKKTIKEFKEIYKKEFNQEIDNTTAHKIVRRYLSLFKVVYGMPINKEHKGHEQQ